MMYILAALSLVVLGIVTLYTLISCGRTRPFVIAILIPLTLAAGSFSIYTLNYYKGTPLEGFPEDTVTVHVIKIGKPDILILAQRPGDDAVRYWAVPYTPENAKAAASAKGSMGNNKPVTGKFKKAGRYNNQDEQVVLFEPTTLPYEDDK